MPSGNVDKPVIEDNRDGTVSIRYDPKEEGLHELALKYNGEHVQGRSVKFSSQTSFTSFSSATQEARSSSTWTRFLRVT